MLVFVIYTVIETNHLIMQKKIEKPPPQFHVNEYVKYLSCYIT
jgi:hypothetical protein